MSRKPSFQEIMIRISVLEQKMSLAAYNRFAEQNTGENGRKNKWRVLSILLKGVRGGPEHKTFQKTKTNRQTKKVTVGN